LYDPQGSLQTVGDKTVISGLRCDASDRYVLLITVGCVSGVSGDFSQTLTKLKVTKK